LKAFSYQKSGAKLLKSVKSWLDEKQALKDIFEIIDFGM